MKPKVKMHEITVRVSNYRSTPTQLIIEPWGDFYPFLPKDNIVIVATGPDPIAPEVVYDDESVTFWSWVGSTIRVYKNGEEIVNYEGLTVPDAFPKKKAAAHPS